MKDKKVISSTEHGHTKRKSSLTNLTAFDSETNVFKVEGKRHVIYIDFSKSLDIASHNIIIDKVMKYWIDNCTMRKILNRLVGL